MMFHEHHTMMFIQLSGRQAFFHCFCDWHGSMFAQSVSRKLVHFCRVDAPSLFCSIFEKEDEKPQDIVRPSSSWGQKDTLHVWQSNNKSMCQKQCISSFCQKWFEELLARSFPQGKLDWVSGLESFLVHPPCSWSCSHKAPCNATKQVWSRSVLLTQKMSASGQRWWVLHNRICDGQLGNTQQAEREKNKCLILFIKSSC